MTIFIWPALAILAFGVATSAAGQSEPSTAAAGSDQAVTLWEGLSPGSAGAWLVRIYQAWLQAGRPGGTGQATKGNTR